MYFFGWRSSLIIFAETWYHNCNIFTHIQKLSYFHVLLEKYYLSFSVQRKNAIFSRRKIPSFQIIQERSYYSAIFWKDHLFRTFEENIIFPCIFWERSSFIFCLKNKMIFLGKRHIIFPDNTKQVIVQHNFLERQSFLKFRKKKYGFSCSVNQFDLNKVFMNYSYNFHNCFECILMNCRECDTLLQFIANHELFPTIRIVGRIAQIYHGL